MYQCDELGAELREGSEHTTYLDPKFTKVFWVILLRDSSGASDSGVARMSKLRA